MSLLVFRGIMAGFRWTFPVVELQGARSKKVRTALVTVLSSLLLALLYDILKALLKSEGIYSSFSSCSSHSPFMVRSCNRTYGCDG